MSVLTGNPDAGLKRTFKVRLYTARTRLTRTQTRLLSGFAIQIEHEPERGKPSTDF